MNMKNQDKTTLPPFPAPHNAGGFTMIELLVVMFVIAMLLAIGIPAAMKFRTQAKINACRVTVNIVDKAVDMYHKQHKRYPEAKEMGGKLIGMSFKMSGGKLTEVDDGHPGPGYRLQPRGTVYGPWNGVDKLPRSGNQLSTGQSDRVHFVDAFGGYIWYCPFKESTYTDRQFDKTDTEIGVTISSIADYAQDSSGRFYRRDYILMSQGANSKWGLIRGAGSDTVPTDDVTNFVRE